MQLNDEGFIMTLGAKLHPQLSVERETQHSVLQIFNALQYHGNRPFTQILEHWIVLAGQFRQRKEEYSR